MNHLIKALNKAVIIAAGAAGVVLVSTLIDLLTFRSAESFFVVLVVTTLVFWRYGVRPALDEIDRQATEDTRKACDPQ